MSVHLWLAAMKSEVRGEKKMKMAVVNSLIFFFNDE